MTPSDPPQSAAGADAGALESGRYDAVTIAAVADDEATLRALLDARASTRLTDRQGRTPPQLAPAHGHAAMVKMLESAGAKQSAAGIRPRVSDLGSR